MCLTPQLIPNPNKGHFVSELLRNTTDCDSAFIKVPCGYCRECIAVKQMYFVQRAMMESLNSHMFFSSLTYDESHLPRLPVSSGFSIPFTDVHHLQLLYKRIRNDNLFGRPFRYFSVSERGSERGRPHAHILWFLPRYDGEDLSDGYSLNKRVYDVVKDCWSENVGSNRSPSYVPLFTHVKRFYRGKLFTNYDTHLVVPSLTSSGISSLAFYCCKYMFKVSDREKRLQQALRLNLPAHEYDRVYPVIKSRSFCSRSFGLGSKHNRTLIDEYIKKCISRSDRSLPYPQFFNPDTGQSFPLCPFYKNNLDYFPYWIASEFSNNEIYNDENKSVSDVQKGISEYNRISSIVDKDLGIQLNFLFE